MTLRRAGILLALAAIPVRADDARPAVPHQRPAALALSQDDKHLFVANERAGTVSVLDTEKQQIVTEFELGGRISDLALSPDDEYLLALDEQSHAVVLLQPRDSELELIERLQINPFPVSIQRIGDSRRFAVASLWSRRLTLLGLADRHGTPGLKITSTINLPFPPREQLHIPGSSRLLVASAFAGELAIIDFEENVISHTVSLPGHNIRGLAISPDRRWLFVAQQVLSPLARTVQDDIHWGNLIANVIRRVPLDDILMPGADVLADSRLFHLGDVGQGSGDPSALAATADGALVVALGGVNEIAVVLDFDTPPRRVRVGRRPTAVSVNSEGTAAFVANTHAGTISIVGLPSTRLITEVSLGRPVELTPAERGELLFYDARLSHDGWLSCHSCHTDGHTSAQLNDNLGDGSFGAPKRILSLLGVAETGPWAWNGAVEELADQVHKSIETTMRGKPISEEHVQDLTAFLRTLQPPPAAGALIEKNTAVVIARGEQLFREQGCVRCHAPPSYTTPAAYEVGLQDEVGNRRFNPPSLRGASQRKSLLHDGRARSLEDLLTEHRHGLQQTLADDALRDLLSFLEGL